MLIMTLQEDQGIYHEKVKEMVRSQGRRLIVNINDLRRKNPQRAERHVGLHHLAHTRFASI